MPPRKKAPADVEPLDDVHHPRRATALFSHAEAAQTLLDAYNSGRMHHAWLITGPRGIGKATLAYRFARFILAQGGEGGDAGLFGAPEKPANLDIDTESSVFRRVAAGGHGDLKVIERRLDEKTGKMRTVIRVEDVRDVGHYLSMTAAEGGWRVVIIDSADEMNVNAANAVLKTLEEPPKRALLLLVCHNPGRLLPTIKSRCRRLALRPLEEATVSQILTAQHPDVAPDEAAILARLAEGSAGRAVELAEEGGLALYNDLHSLLETLPQLDVGQLYKVADKVARRGADAAFRTLTDLLRWWLGRLILKGAGGPVAASDVENQLMERLLAGAPLDRWLEVWEKSNHLLSRADAVNLDRKQVVLNVFLALEDAARG